MEDLEAIALQLERAADLCARIHPGADCERIQRQNAAGLRARIGKLGRETGASAE